MNDGQVVLVDEAYIRESMMQPQAKIVDGFEPIMPTFQGLLQAARNSKASWRLSSRYSRTVTAREVRGAV